MATRQAATILTKHAEYDKLSPLWKKCRDAAAGEEAVHAAREAYLPRLSDQDEPSYTGYLMRAGFFNATYRTIDGLGGMMFRRPPKVELPGAAMDWLEDIDLQGTPFLIFLQDGVEETLTVGKFGILVDYPAVSTPTDQGTLFPTKADSARMNLRPTLQMYKTESIYNWRTARVNNKTVLVHVVLEECTEEPVDEFRTKPKKQYRVLDLFEGKYRQRVFELTGDGNSQIQIGGDIFPTKDQTPLDFIPFFTVGECDEPPLLDLVNVNLSHYRVSADYEHGCHFTGLPTAVVTGYSPADPAEKLYIGSTAAWIFKDPNAKASFLEFTGTGMQALKDNLTAKEQQMAVLGARMLEQQKKMVETAEVAAIHRSGENSLLSAYAQMISTKVEDALEVMCWWGGLTSEIEDDGVEFELNRDFYPTSMSPQELTAVLGVYNAGGMSKESLFQYLQDREIISKDTTYEEESTKIEAEGPKLAGGLSGSLLPPGPAPAPATKPAAPPVKQPTNAK